MHSRITQKQAEMRETRGWLLTSAAAAVAEADTSGESSLIPGRSVGGRGRSRRMVQDKVQWATPRRGRAVESEQRVIDRDDARGGYSASFEFISRPHAGELATDERPHTHSRNICIHPKHNIRALQNHNK